MSSLAQIIAYRLFSAKPLSKPMLAYCWFDPWQQTSVKLRLESIFFFQENTFENIVSKKSAILSRPQCVDYFPWELFSDPSWIPWWRHQMETFSALLALCVGNSPVTGEFPTQRPVLRSFDIFFELSLIKRLSEQSRRRWFGTPSRSLWRQRNAHRWAGPTLRLGWRPSHRIPTYLL